MPRRLAFRSILRQIDEFCSQKKFPAEKLRFPASRPDIEKFSRSGSYDKRICANSICIVSLGVRSETAD
jgi:hypothetical protein